MHTLRTRLTLVLMMLGVFVIGACALGDGSTSATTTATTTTTSGCAAVSGFQTDSPASGGAHFSDVPFPAGAVSKASAAPEANGFQYELLSACAPRQSAAAITAYYHAQMESHGWMAQSTAPVTGDLASACPAGSVCYAKGGVTLRYVVVQPPVAGGTAATWTLQLIVQPLAFGGAELDPSNHTLDVDPLGPGSGHDDLSWNGSILSLINSAQAVSLGLKGSLNAVTCADLAGAAYSSAALSGGSLAPATVIAVCTRATHIMPRYASQRSAGAISPWSMPPTRISSEPYRHTVAHAATQYAVRRKRRLAH
jgi:hypothetical protein